jgi:hypothetical protein
VTVAAGIVGNALMAAMITDINMTAKSGSASSFDCFHGFKLMKWKRVDLTIFGIELGENILKQLKKASKCLREFKYLY